MLQPQITPYKLTNSSLGALFEGTKDYDGAIHCFESALRQNAYSVPALLGIANIFRSKDVYPQAIEYLRAITKFEERNGEVWETLGKSANSCVVALSLFWVLFCLTD